MEDNDTLSIAYEVTQEDIIGFNLYHIEHSPTLRKARWQYYLLPPAIWLAIGSATYALAGLLLLWRLPATASLKRSDDTVIWRRVCLRQAYKTWRSINNDYLRTAEVRTGQWDGYDWPAALIFPG